MKKILILLLISMTFTIEINSQNLFFIGEKSYPCTETITLPSNSDEFYINDLNVIFAKDGKTALIGVSTKTNDVIIRGKLIVYLDDGAVITLNDEGDYNYVDKIAKAVYFLTNEELNKMKISNINTIRFTLEREGGGSSPFGGNFSASNKGSSKTDFTAVISEFYSK